MFVTKNSPDIGLTHVVQHHGQIQLKPDAQPKHHRPYRLPPDKKQVLRHQLDELLRQNIIAPVHESENVPITNACRTIGFVVIFDTLTPLRKNLGKIYLIYRSLQNLSKYTAFNTCYGTFKFLRLPMGLKTSPKSFQLLMDKVFRGLTFKSVLCYLDDVLICSETFEQHFADLQGVFNRFYSAGLKLQPSKCHFAQRRCVFLGHEISRDGIKPPSNKVELILNYPSPTNIKELRRIMGLFNWFRKFIPNYSAIAQPILKLMKKNTKFNWTSEQSSAFAELKRLLKHFPFLSFPR